MPGIIATRIYEPGDIIYTEEPLARVTPKNKKDDNCEFCGKSSKNLISCSACSVVKYCGIECQAKDKDDHGMECRKMEKFRDSFPDDFTRLVGRIILKMKGKDWKKITRNVMGTDVSFDDIDDQYEQMTKNPRLVLYCEGIKETLEDYIGQENMPDEDDLIKIIGKVRYSLGFISDSASLFCFGMSEFEHECIPNANIELFNDGMKIWAIKRIECSEKISISHRGILTTDSIRIPVNEDQLEVCKCTECSLPYGESVLTKILDKRKAYRLIRSTENLLKMAEILSNLDLENDFRLRRLVDDMLEMHEGVLGQTNALHIKLLAIKAMMIETTLIQRKKFLTELEKHMSSVFGEYYLEMCRIYKGLTVTHFELGNLKEAKLYLQKMRKVQMHKPKEPDEEE